MSIELSHFGYRRLKRKQFPLVQSSFYTDLGPKNGTIWFDNEREDGDKRKLMVVKYMTGVRVVYEGGDWELRRHFAQQVAAGRYILVGVEAPSQSVTEV